MAENEKKSFILYYDQFSELEFLNMEERGEMITAVFQYAQDGIIPDFKDRSLSLVFKRFKDTLDRDLTKYRSMCEIRRVNGKKGGRPKTENNLKKPNGFSKNLTEPKKADICNMTTDNCNMLPVNYNIPAVSEIKTYGLYNNIQLSENDLELLKKEFPTDWSDRIESVSSWYHNKGLNCTNGAAQVRNWKMRGAKTNGKYGKDDNQENELEIFEQYNI